MFKNIVALSLASSALALADKASRSVPQYDFIVVGGGTSGLVVANRLTEDANVKVAVIEAGSYVYNNTNVTSVLGYGLALETSIDWAYQSSPQLYTGNDTKTMSAGKALGGTSTINGMVYARAETSQIDAWELLGNDGWNWDGLLPYYKKSEDFEIPTSAEIANGASYNPKYHGYNGPLTVGWAKSSVQMNASAAEMINDTYAAVGLPMNPDYNGGKMRGFSFFQRTLNREENVREDAARAYYYPFETRPNLHIYLNSFAERLTWDSKSQDSKPVASGVVFTDAKGTSHTLEASKEVILSAGSLRSPLILELSGVGNPTILEKYGIDVKVDLPTVGENLQDQTTGDTEYTLSTEYGGLADYLGYFSASDIFGNDTSAINSSTLAALPTYAQQIAKVSNVDANITESFLRIQHQLIFNNEIPIAEILVTPGSSSKALSVEYWGLLPFSRGNIHITSADARSQKASINPNYFMLKYDAQQQVGTAKMARRIANTQPLSDIVTGETVPGFDAVPQDATDAEWAEYLKSTYRSNFHYISTAAMMSRELGGVVDNTLLVYGTANVRVVDASVLPFQVCGHLVSTLYAVAEKAADAIKAKYA